MTKTVHPQLNLERWSPYVLAARQAGQSLAAYARDHALSRHTLYAAQRAMRADGARAIAKPPRTTAGKRGTPAASSRASLGEAFIPVTLAAMPPTITVAVQLPNGIGLQTMLRCAH